MPNNNNNNSSSHNNNTGMGIYAVVSVLLKFVHSSKETGDTQLEHLPINLRDIFLVERLPRLPIGVMNKQIPYSLMLISQILHHIPIQF